MLPSAPVSEDFSDIIIRRQLFPLQLAEQYEEQTVDDLYSVVYVPLSEQLAFIPQIGYSGVPKLFTFLGTSALEASGILTVQTQPYLNLKGRDVLVGFLDSGIDYMHPAFRYPDGTTRILAIWDQTDQSGTPPAGLSYGTEYRDTRINQALFSPDPYAIVPSRDENGHGTAVAGIACGSADPESDFTGAAPESSLLVVRLKPAKQYLRDYFLIPDGADAFQENDIMLGIRYLIDTAIRMQMPLVICIAVGTNQGGHTGDSPLEEVLQHAQLLNGVYAVTGTGNEAGMAHHFYGRLERKDASIDVELSINREITGITLEFWANPQDLYGIGFLSPLGESIQPVYHGPFSYREFQFTLEPARIQIYFSTLEDISGQQVAVIRLLNPSPGLWRLRISSRFFVNGAFHMWLPISGLIPEGITFLSPVSDTTLVIPSCPEQLFTVAAYNSANGALFLRSGRGYTRNTMSKPDFAAPGVELTAPVPESGGSYASLTGSSAASALAAGSVALLTEWSAGRFHSRYFSSPQMKNIILRGLSKKDSLTYPNREWGYGTLDVYRIFEVFGLS